MRKDLDASERLSFEEFAILCRLRQAGHALNTSAIAAYQGALRPTMTHRTNHLAKLGLIDRAEGTLDRRNVECCISDRGDEFLDELCGRVCCAIPAGYPLARTNVERVCKYVDAMGAVYCTAGGLILLALYLKDDRMDSVANLVEGLGLLQPTVSMAVGSLERAGKVVRVQAGRGSRTTGVRLSEAGWDAADALAGRIGKVVVRRRPRTPKGQ